jgi:hypothetical protein
MENIYDYHKRAKDSPLNYYSLLYFPLNFQFLDFWVSGFDFFFPVKILLLVFAGIEGVLGIGKCLVLGRIVFQRIGGVSKLFLFPISPTTVTGLQLLGLLRRFKD